MPDDPQKPINDGLAMRRFSLENNGWAKFEDRIERMFKKIHAVEDECPQLRVECYGEEEVAVSEPEVRPLGQLDLFSYGDAAA